MHKIIFGVCLNMAVFMNFNKFNGQQSPFTRVSDSLLENVDKSGVKTGILYDRVFPFARLDQFGRKSVDTTGFDHFRQSYSELYSGHYHPQGHLVSPENWDEILDWNRHTGILPVGVMDMKFNQLKPDAVSRKILIEHNGLFYNNAAKKENPFMERNLKIATLLGESIETGKTILRLDPDLVLSNTGRKIDHIDLKVGSGERVYSMYPGGSTAVDFDEEGVIHVNTKVYFTTGESFSSESAIEVKKRTTSAEITQPDSRVKLSHQPCLQETVRADIPFTGYDETVATLGQVEVNYFYHYDPSDSSGCTLKKIRKPIIVLDGFDPTDKRDATWIYEHNFRYYNGKNEVANFADEQRRAGFDIIIINMPSYQTGEKNIPLPDGTEAHIGTLRRAGGDFIEINAMALIKVIQNLNGQLASQGSKEKLIVVGPSMGGVISRYGLSYMEKKGMDHNVGLWFSWDATHLGSVLPIGNQYFIESMAKLGLKNVKDIIARQINSAASKQELNHHFLANSPEPEGAPEFKDRFYAGIDTMGWPQHTRKIAMISGAIGGIPQPKGKAGGTAFDFKLKMNSVPRLLLFNAAGLFLDPNFIRAKISFSPSAEMGSTEVLDMKVLGFPVQKKSALPFEHSQNSMDLIQGGWYPGFQEIRDSTKDKLHGFFKWMAKPQFLDVVENHCHQPSVNTLAFGQGPHPNPNRKWDDDLTKVNFNCGDEKETPWDAWYAPDENLRHDSLTYEYAWRMRDEMNGIHMPQPKVVRNVTIAGNKGSVFAGEIRTFTIPTPDKQTYYNWNLSNTALEVIDGQGTATITVKYTGGAADKCDIGCTAVSNCYTYQINGITLNSFKTKPEDVLITKIDPKP
ncbi:MAG: hypothetical protein ABIX01_02270 [Chitinophagaceae bacterium]